MSFRLPLPPYSTRATITPQIRNDQFKRGLTSSPRDRGAAPSQHGEGAAARRPPTPDRPLTNRARSGMTSHDSSVSTSPINSPQKGKVDSTARGAVSLADRRRIQMRGETRMSTVQVVQIFSLFSSLPHLTHSPMRPPPSTPIALP